MNVSILTAQARDGPAQTKEFTLSFYAQVVNLNSDATVNFFVSTFLVYISQHKVPKYL